MRTFPGFRTELRLSLFVGFAALFPVTTANAQTIVHVDPPDIILTAIANTPGMSNSSSHELDVNADSRADMLFYGFDYPTQGAQASYQNLSDTKHVGRFLFVNGLDSGALIGPASPLDSSGGDLRVASNFGTSQGDWNNGEDRFLGYVLGHGTASQKWGWVRLSVNVTADISQITIKDWAYDNAGQSIVAGDTGAVPEPGALVMFLPALAVVGLLRKRARSGDRVGQ